MIKAMGFFSGERTQHVFGWASIIWFTSAVSIAGSLGVELKTTPDVLASCGDNVTLTCNAISSQKMDIKLFAWLAGNKIVCQHEHKQSYPDVQCENSTESPYNHTLTLTLTNVMPVNEGKYLCKLQSTVGVSSKTTFLTVKDCLESSDSFINSSHAECRFSGVYPSSTVHWFRGDENLTDSAFTHDKKDQDGQYNVISEIMVQKEGLLEPYTCSLWMRDDRKYLSSQQLFIAAEQKSSGSTVKLQWLCIMVEIMMVKSIM